MIEFLQFLWVLAFIAGSIFLGLLQYRKLRRERRNEQFKWAVLRTARYHEIPCRRR